MIDETTSRRAKVAAALFGVLLLAAFAPIGIHAAFADDCPPGLDDNPGNDDNPGHDRCEAVTPSPAVAAK